MRRSRHGLLADYGQSFDDSSRPSLPTVAEPSWFAPPLDVRENRDAMTLLFDVAERDKRELRVELGGNNLVLWGPRLRRRDRDGGRRAMRVFALPFDPRGLRTSWCGNVLRVRIGKKESDWALPEPRFNAA